MAPSVLVLFDVALHILLVLKVEIIYELVCLCDSLLPLASSSFVTSIDFCGLFLAPVSVRRHQPIHHSTTSATYFMTCGSSSGNAGEGIGGGKSAACWGTEAEAPNAGLGENAGADG